MADPNRALWFAFEGERLLVFEEGPVRVPLTGGPEELNLNVTFRWEIGELDGHTCWAVETDSEPPEGMVFRDLRSFFFGVDENFFRTAGRAKQIVGWHATHRFCGRCGGETELVSGELAKRCTRCGMMHYPRLSPAAIVLVERGDHILLARSPGFPKGLYSVLAGFVEPGEAIEETVVREIKEEVGIDIDDVDWKKYDPRQYDPRRIIKEALLDDDTKPVSAGAPAAVAAVSGAAAVAAADSAAPQRPERVVQSLPPGEAAPYDTEAT